MATPWIKVEVTTWDKIEVHRMSDILRIDPDAVLGKLVRIWSWADVNTHNGHADGVTMEMINRVLHHPNFAQAMRAVGWLEADADGVRFPNFDHHNGDSAKARAQASRRQQVRRTLTDRTDTQTAEQSPSGHTAERSSVTQMSRSQRDKSVTRQDKNRLEKNGSKDPPATKRAPPAPATGPPGGGDGGLSDFDQGKGAGPPFRWERSLSLGELSDPQALQVRFEELTAKGIVNGSDTQRTAFFALAAYCRREGKTNPCGLLTRLLRSADLFGRGWNVKPTQADEEWARAALRKLQQPVELPRDSDLAVDPDYAAADRLLDRMQPNEIKALVADECGPEWAALVTDKPPTALRERLRERILAERQKRQLQRAS